MKIVKIGNNHEVKIDEEDYEKYSQQNYVWDIVYARRGVVSHVRVMLRGVAGTAAARKQFKRPRIRRLIMGLQTLT